MGRIPQRGQRGGRIQILIRFTLSISFIKHVIRALILVTDWYMNRVYMCKTILIELFTCMYLLKFWKGCRAVCLEARSCSRFVVFFLNGVDGLTGEVGHIALHCVSAILCFWVGLLLLACRVTFLEGMGKVSKWSDTRVFIHFDSQMCLFYVFVTFANYSVWAGADLGGSSTYSTENFEAWIGDALSVNSLWCRSWR